MKKVLLTAATLLTMSATTIATAQVTIGSLNDPQQFSILELDGNGARGMRLPQMTAAEREALNLKSLTGETAGKAQGLQIFNTDTRCVETWNGSKWIEACGEAAVESPQAASKQFLCVMHGENPSVESLTATGIADGATVNWYLSGSPDALPDSHRFEPGDYTLYVSQTVNGVESARTEVAVTVIETVADPYVIGYVIFCSSENGKISDLVERAEIGNIIKLKWYKQLHPELGTEYTDPDNTPIVDGQNYYVCNTVNGCESDRLIIQVAIRTTPDTPEQKKSLEFCGDRHVGELLDNTLFSGEDYFELKGFNKDDWKMNWYREIEGVPVLLGDENWYDNLEPGIYYVSQSNKHGNVLCESEKIRVEITKECSD
jgi:hypothetical protein